MVIIWKGKGRLVLLIFLGSFVVVILNAAWLSGGKDPAGDPLMVRLVLAGSFVLSGAVCYLLGRHLNRPGPVVIDRRTGREMRYQPNHHLYYVRIEHWGLAFMVVGVIWTFTDIF